MLKIGESYETEEGNSYQCFYGKQGGVRLQYNKNGYKTERSESCFYDGKPAADGQTVKIDGFSFKCSKKGERFEWEWENGEDYKFEDGSTLAINQKKRVGDVTYQYVARELIVEIIVIGVFIKS